MKAKEGEQMALPIGGNVLRFPEEVMRERRFQLALAKIAAGRDRTQTAIRNLRGPLEDHRIEPEGPLDRLPHLIALQR